MRDGQRRDRWWAGILVAAAVGLGLGTVLPAAAHKLRPAVVDVVFQKDGTFSMELRLNLEAMLAGIGPQHAETRDAPQAEAYDALRALPPTALEARARAFEPQLVQGLEASFDGQRVTLRLIAVVVPEVGDVRVARVSTLLAEGGIPVHAREFNWRYSPAFGSNVIKLRNAGEEASVSHWLTNGAQSEPFLLGAAVVPKSRAQVTWRYLTLGFTHILPLGLDHILFVVGIFLLSLHLRPIVWQVSAFTLAHTITLGLSIYGVVSVSPAIVEPLIALSIVYVGLENAFSRELSPWRVFVVFGFGLLHGLGFAGVLTDIGLPRTEFLTALISFNIGVELGQLAVIAIAFAAVGLWFRMKPWYRQRVIIPGSLAIAVVGSYWFVERIGL